MRIFFALSYYRDAGEPHTGITGHDGDSEFIVLELHNNMNPFDYARWSLDFATLSAHWGASSGADPTATYAATDLEYPSAFRGRPRIWVSWNKHANYRSKSVCDNMWNDECDTMFTGTTYDDLEVLPDGNLGNSFNAVPARTDTKLVDCTTSRHPRSGRAGTGIECFWEDSPLGFGGWNQYRGQPTAGSYAISLSFFSF